MRRIATPLLLIFVAVASAHAEEIRGKVISIADGDTITVLDAQKQKHKIRLHGIDAPEKSQAFGSKSKAALSEKIGEKNVVVEWKGRDRYGRIVGDVYLDNRNINLEMVRDGMAWHYRQFSKSKELAAAEETARKERRGLWVDKSPEPPWEFRKKEREEKTLAARTTPMSIPDYETIMVPLLEALGDGKEYLLRDVTRQISDRFGLTDEERQRLLPSGQQTIISNRVSWARTYLKKAGLVVSTGRGKVQITAEGKRVLIEEKPAKIDTNFLERYPSYVEFKETRHITESEVGTFAVPTNGTPADQTPEEAIESAYRDLRAALADDLLDRVRGCSPEFFERLVVQLLVAMGYGGSLADAGKAVGRSGDEGIDGIIKEDKLGLDVVCIQAKRWENTVGRPHVQAFAGSMEGHRAKKGVMLTTSSFSKDAHDYISRIERRIVLIDGRQLAELMIDHGIGTTVSKSYEVRRIDSDFFVED